MSSVFSVVFNNCDVGQVSSYSHVAIVSASSGLTVARFFVFVLFLLLDHGSVS